MMNNVIKIIKKDLDVSHLPSFMEAQLIYVNGNGKLKTTTQIVDDDNYGNRYFTHISLNDTPLVQINSPACPTCNGLLSTGYGVDKSEFMDITEQINSEYQDLEKSIQDIEPLLNLLEKGLYVVADVICYPTDGNGNFFWNVSNNPTDFPATGSVLLTDQDYAYIYGQPVFLYPTENTDCFNNERVEYYIDKFKNSDANPRAIIYNFGEFISFIIDGHHKACAAALLGKPLNCLAIIPLSDFGYKQAGIKSVVDMLYFLPLSIKAKNIPKEYIPISDHITNRGKVEICTGNIIKRTWEDKYLTSAKHYPTVFEYAQMLAFDIVDITDSLIAECFANFDEYNQSRLKTILFIMSNKQDSRLKKIALKCAKLGSYKLKIKAYKLLSEMKNDVDVENLFIEHLIDNNDKNNPLTKIADSYWST